MIISYLQPCVTTIRKKGMPGYTFRTLSTDMDYVSLHNVNLTFYWYMYFTGESKKN